MEKRSKIIAAVAIAGALGIAYALLNFTHPALAGASDGFPGSVQSPPEPLEVNIVSVEHPEIFKTIIAEKEFVNVFDPSSNFLLGSRDINTVVEIIEKVAPPTSLGLPAIVETASKKVELLICDKRFPPTAPVDIKCSATNMVPTNIPLPPAVNCRPVPLSDPIAMGTAVKDFNIKLADGTKIKQSVVKTVKVEKEVLNCETATAPGPIFEIFLIEEIVEQPNVLPPKDVIKTFENVICVKEPQFGSVIGCQITFADGRTQNVVPETELLPLDIGTSG